MSRKLTTEEFIERIEKKYPNKFDFSKVEYKSIDTKIIIFDRQLEKQFEVLPRQLLKAKNYGNLLKKIDKDYKIPIDFLNKLTPKEEAIRKQKENNLIEKLKNIYGDRFDYSQVIYKNIKTPIILICNLCKSKIISYPRQLLKGKAHCSCSNKKNWTKSEFIQYLKINYDFEFDESFEFKDMYSLIEIWDKDHQERLYKRKPIEFLTFVPERLKNILDKEKAKEIREESKLSPQEIFIEKAKLIYKDQYDYSKVKYISSDIPVEIICPKHGSFLVTPHKFLRNELFSICPKCAEEIKLQKLWDSYLERFKEKYGNKYDYSESIFLGSKVPIKIRCTVHNEIFYQLPYRHLRSEGCKKCNFQSELTRETFIEKAKVLYGNFYDYSKVVFINSLTPVEVVCPIHGSFWVTPRAHLNHLQKCNKCSNHQSYGELFINNFLTKELGIDYKFQKGFDDLIGLGGNKLRFDFYLEKYNIAIEYQGEQHYKLIPKFTPTQKDFEKLQEHDKIKKDYCKEKDIYLIEILYTEKGNDIRYHLLKEFNSLGVIYSKENLLF